jgi:two-component sensor histidine kinase
VSILADGPSIDRIGAGVRNGRMPAGTTNLPHQRLTATAAARMQAGSLALPSVVHGAARIVGRHPAFGYIAAFVFVAIATALQWLARDLYEGTPFVAVYPAIVLAGLLGGYQAGLLAAFVAGLAQWLLFIPEPHVLGILTYGYDVILGMSLIAYINRSLARETLAKERQELLKDELHHRMQNMFAVIQSIIRFSLADEKEPVCPRAIEHRLADRLQAMFDANRYVDDTTGNVALLDLIRGQIRGLGNRIIIRGRSDMTLDAQMTQNVSLILHELVTNSFKHGALSAPAGRVQIDVKPACDGVTFDWTEFDGPPVRAPADDGSGGGFGSRILGPFACGCCTDVRICYEPSGFRYGLRIPRGQQV